MNDQPTTQLAIRRDYDDMHSQALAFASSQYFGQMRASQAVTKILAGQELGMTPMAAMTGIYLVEGKIQIGSTALAAVVQNSERFDYRIVAHDDKRCEIQFIVDGEAREPTSVFTIEDATRAGLAGKKNWQGYARNMLFARAMSNGVKWHCPGLLAGMPVYTEGDDLTPAPAVPYNGPIDDLTPRVVEAEVVEETPEQVVQAPAADLASEGQKATIAGIVDTCDINEDELQKQLTATGVVDDDSMTSDQADQIIGWLQSKVGEEVPS